MMKCFQVLVSNSNCAATAWSQATAGATTAAAAAAPAGEVVCKGGSGTSVGSAESGGSVGSVGSLESGGSGESGGSIGSVGSVGSGASGRGNNSGDGWLDDYVSGGGSSKEEGSSGKDTDDEQGSARSANATAAVAAGINRKPDETKPKPGGWSAVGIGAVVVSGAAALSAVYRRVAYSAAGAYTRSLQSST